MVEEVVRGEAELQLLRFTKAEILEEREVAVEKRGTLDIGEDVVTVVTHRWQRKTRTVDELALFQIRGRIARYARLQCDVRRSGDCLVIEGAAIRECSCQIEIGVTIGGLEVRTTTQLRDAGDLPAVRHGLGHCVRVRRIAQLDGVSGVEDMGTIVA